MTDTPPASAATPLNDYEVTILATYNAESGRGLLHDDDWREAMARLQERFDAAGVAARPRKRGRWGSNVSEGVK